MGARVDDAGRIGRHVRLTAGMDAAGSVRGESNQGNSFASFLLGYPTTGSVPITTPVNVFTNYAAAYIQDDLRVNSRLTLNFGLRYEYETGLQEEENRFTVAFDREAVSPLAAKTGLNLRGGLRYAGQDGFPEHQGDPSRDEVLASRRAAWSLSDKTVVRGRIRTVLVAVDVSGIRDGQLGADRLHADDLHRHVQHAGSDDHARRSVPEWLVAAGRQQPGPGDRNAAAT